MANHLPATDSPGAPRRDGRVLHTTLLDLVYALSEVAGNDDELVLAVNRMLRNGKARLTGSFRDTPPEDLVSR